MTFWTDKVFIIGEAGVNHNGDLDKARRLIDVAVEAGCDAVKFQTFRASALVARSAGMADYQKVNTGRDESQHAMLQRLELDDDAHYMLKAHAEQQGIVFFSTAFDLQSLDFLSRLNIPVWKIPSGEITNYPYLVKVAGLGKPVILSTGMATLAEIDDAVRTLTQNGLRRDRLCILHCNTEYPTPMGDVNLKAMAVLGQAFGTAYGYSDHTHGIEIPVAATALGGRVLEKHFTLDRKLPGPDHAASLEPAELARMVAAVRMVEQALGDGIKQPTASESKNRGVARKSVVAARPIRAGEAFSADNLTVKRPGGGISPMEWPRLMGHLAARDFGEDEAIQW
jgi:N,N'-diacetyllegionaminate synthase